ncbi:hypothetical protein AADR41_22275 [Streptomyces sp. CLV115]|uniref:hypothetical protein n=1 Tax=Streptomyces sp. CLV115 TaxID=3138502 RepID=UPI00313E9CAD
MGIPPVWAGCCGLSEKPRRRDVVLRIFHHLFASSAAGLNSYECDALRTWLTETEVPTASTAWREDPLDTTLVRLETSVTEGKGTKWIAVTTARTIITALLIITAVLDAPGSSKAESAPARCRPTLGRVGDQPLGH